MSEQPFLRLDRLTRIFADTRAVSDLSLDLAEHEIVTLLGPSGCGKTTTLRMVAGFELPDRGRVLLEGKDLTRAAPQRRGFGMVFQHYALFPHLSVGANVGFGLAGLKLSDPETRERVGRALELVRLPEIEDRSIGSLSGGQQQRVALARALAPEPRVLLLDEPLSNLDAALREQTRRELRSLVKEIGITTLYVTHDQEEAFDLSDRIAVMREGRLDQLGPAETLYHRPATQFVATFLGRAGVAEAEAVSIEEGLVQCRLADGVVWPAYAPAPAPVPAPAGGAKGQLAPHMGAKLRVFARPEALTFVASGAEGALRGTVADRRFAGSFYLYKVLVRGGELEVQAGADAADPGDVVGLRPASAPDGIFAFVKDPEPGSG